GDYRVPFLSVPSIPWPDFLLRSDQYGVEGVYCANLRRTANKTKIDLNTDCGLSGECKDLSSDLDADRFVKILQKIPKDSRLHIAITNTLQKSYFSKSEEKKERAIRA